MALVLADRVQETSTSTGTGSFTLAGAVVGYQTFAIIGNGNTCYYTIADQGGANWEVGIGTYSTTGPTLARTTVLSNSDGNTSPVNFPAGTKTVFVTYPSEKSVNLDSSGNVSALGTVSSGTWQGTTVGVAYGGTGVTASSGPNSVVLRDANGNITGVNNVEIGLTLVTSAGGTTTLTASSTQIQILTGSANQTFKLPDATTLTAGTFYTVSNSSSGVLTITDNADTVIETIAQGGAAQALCVSTATSAGTWGFRVFAASNVTWGNANLDYNGTITSATWEGDTVASGYGGTGLTTFTAANNALYSTSSSALTAGTLPVLAGGTGTTTSTGSGNVVLSTSPTLVTPALGTPSSGNLANCTGYPAGSISGTVAIANGGTGQTTASAAFNALSPITTAGDLILGNGANSATRLGIGSNGQVLTANGTTASWEDLATGGGTVTTTDFTATSGQTTFTVSYTVGSTEVYQNGVKLGIADFTATNGSTIVLATGATAGDLVEVVTFSVLNLYSTITYEDFSGDGTTTVFTMSAVPANSASLLVAISGVVQDPGTYTVSSTTLTFGTAPPSGSSNISVRYLGVASASTVGSFSAGTTGLTPASSTTGAIVLGGTLVAANGGTGLTSPGTSGNVLTSNGTAWTSSAPSGGGQYYGTATPKAIAYNAQVISENITILANTNGLSAGPITVDSGYAVTVASGAYWVIVSN